MSKGRAILSHLGFDELAGTSLLSRVSRTYIPPETIRPGSAMECVNTRGPGVSLSVRGYEGGAEGGGGGSGGGGGGNGDEGVDFRSGMW